MNLEQAKELESNRRMLVYDEAGIVGIDTHDKKYKHLFNAISAWGESLADLRSHQSVEERMVAAAEATQRYVTEKRV
jgi:hypothetical protein